MSYPLTENLNQAKTEYIDGEEQTDIVVKQKNQLSVCDDSNPSPKVDLMKTAPSNLPTWVSSLFVHQQKTDCEILKSIALSLKSCTLPKVTLKIHNPRLENFDRDRYLKLINDKTLTSQTLFTLYNKAPRLVHKDGSESVNIIDRFLREAGLKECLCQIHTKDNKYKFSYRISYFCFQWDSSNVFFVFIHESMFEGRPSRFSIIVSDHFSTFYESTYHYLTKTLSKYGEGARYISREFIYKYYTRYIAVQEEEIQLPPVCIVHYLRQGAYINSFFATKEN